MSGGVGRMRRWAEARGAQGLILLRPFLLSLERCSWLATLATTHHSDQARPRARTCAPAAGAFGRLGQPFALFVAVQRNSNNCKDSP